MRQSQGRGSKVETEARPCDAEARPSQLKKLPRAEADASRTTSLLFTSLLANHAMNGSRCNSVGLQFYFLTGFSCTQLPSQLVSRYPATQLYGLIFIVACAHCGDTIKKNWKFQLQD